MFQIPEPKQETKGKWVARRQGKIICEDASLNGAMNKVREMEEKDRKGVNFAFIADNQAI